MSKDEKKSPQILEQGIDFNDSTFAEGSNLVVQELIERVDAEIANIESVVGVKDTGDYPELVEEVKELEKLKEEAVQVRETLVQKLKRILLHPTTVYKKNNMEIRGDDELIQAIEGQLGVIDDKIKKSRKKDRNEENIFLASFDEDLLKILSECDKISKKDSECWKNLTKKADQMLEIIIDALLAEGNIEKALRLFDYFSDLDGSDSFSDLDRLKMRIVNQVVGDYETKNFTSNRFDFSLFLEKRAYFKQLNSEILLALGNREVLIKCFDKYFLSKLFDKIFSKEEIFLFRQPEEKIKNFYKIDVTYHEKFLKLWIKGTEDLEQILEHKDVARMIDILVNIPDNIYRRSGAVEYLEKILVDFSQEELSERWSIINLGLKKTSFSWDKLYALCHISTELEEKEMTALNYQRLEEIITVFNAYGIERLKEIWNKKQLYDVQSFCVEVESELQDFAVNLPVSLKKHLQSLNIYNQSGNKQTTDFDYYLREIEKLHSLSQKIPEQYREDFFSAVSVEKYLPSTYDVEDQTEDVVKNFIEFITNLKKTSLDFHIGLHQYFENSKYFSEQHYVKLAKGLDFFTDNIKKGPKLDGYYIGSFLDLLVHSGTEGAEYGNKINILFSQSSNYVLQEDYDLHKVDRNYEDYLNIHRLIEVLRDNFGENFGDYEDFICDDLSLDDLTRQALHSFFTGEIINFNPNSFDLLIIEGKLLRVFQKFKENLKDEKYAANLKIHSSVIKELSGNERKIYDQFVSRTRRFEGVSPEKLAEVVRSGKMEKMLQCIEKLDGRTIKFEQLIKIIDHPGIWGIINEFSYYSLSEQLFDKLISVSQGAGDLDFLKSKYRNSGNRLESYWVDTFLNFDLQKMIAVINFARSISFNGRLVDILHLSSDEDDSILKDRIKLYFYTESDCLRSGSKEEDAKISAMATLAEKNYYRLIEVLGREIDYSEKYNFQHFLISDAFELIITREDLLQKYLKHGTYFDERILDFPKEIIDNPVFWSNFPPVEILSDVNEVIKYLKLMEWMKNNDVDTYNFNYKLLAEIFERSPWIFEAKKRNPELFVSHRDIFEIEEMGEEKVEHILHLLEYIQVDERYKWEEQLKNLSESSEQIIIKVSLLINEKIPASIISELIKLVSDNEIDVDLIEALDNHTENSHEWRKWWYARRRGKIKSVSSEIPVTQDKFLVDYFSDYHLSGPKIARDVYLLAEKIAVLEPDKLKKLERLAIAYTSGDGKDRYLYDADVSVLDLLDAKDFDAICSIAEKNHEYIYKLLNLDKEKLQYFLDNVDSNFIDYYEKITAIFSIDLVDALYLSKGQNIDKLIEFGQELKIILGEQFSVSVYDLLLMDFEKDLENLKKVNENIHLVLDRKLVERLILLTEGDIRLTLERILSVMNRDFKMQESDFLERIARVDPVLRKKVFIEKIGAANWSFFDNIDENLSLVGLEEKDIAFIFRLLYSNKGFYDIKPEVLDKILDNSSKAEYYYLSQYFEDMVDRKQLNFDYFKYLKRFSEMVEGAGNTGEIKKLQQLIVKSLIHFDPTVKKTFTDPNKLGRLRETFIRKMTELVAGGIKNVTENQLRDVVLGKLREIKKLYESSDTPESTKRFVFMDLYNLEKCFDQDFVKAVIGDETDKERINTLISTVIKRDVEEVLLQSGNSDEIRKRSVDEEIDGEVVLSEADQRNRRLVGELEKRNAGQIFLIDNLGEESITHGTDSQYLENILESGNFSGELLGSVTRTDLSGLLGVDVSKVLKADKERNFKEKYSALNNISYGDIHIIYSYYRTGKNGEKRKPIYVGVIGKDHELIRSGLPTSEITAIVIKAVGILDEVKQKIATKGMYIPILDQQGSLLFTPEEFDEMKVFYLSLSRVGYPKEVINDVFRYYRQNDLGPKHRIVIDKAVEAIIKGQSKEDLAVLVSFLQSNDLNKESVDWYREVSFQEIMDFVRGRTKQKIKEKAKRDIIGSIKRFNKSIRVEKSPDELITEEEIVNNIFVHDFLQYQLPFTLFGKQFEQLTDGEKVELRKESNKYVQAIIQLSVGEIRKSSTKKTETPSKRILEIADLFSEQKKQLMQRLWEDVWKELGEGGRWTPEILAEYKKLIVPAIAGSGGRREIVLGSDLDYNLIVDDEQIVEEDRERILAGLKDFVNNDLSARMNEILGKNRIRADAGLAKKDRMPFTLVSTIAKFEINLASNRQEEEPTEVTDTDPLFAKDNGVIEKMRDNLLVVNPSADMLPAYIQRDLEIGTGKQSFMEQFENLFASIASGQMMEHIKDSLQRPIMFKLDYLLYEGLNSRPELKAEVKNIPADTAGKIEFLKKHKILNQREANICLELLAFAYKSRFLGELYSEEAKQDELKKVKNVVFKVEDLSYGERERLIELLKEFKSEVLYK